MTQPAPALSSPEITSLLRRSKAKIIEEWEKQSREEIPAARETSRLSLINSLPLFLDQLADSIESPSSETERNTGKIACEHGKERAELENYSLGQVIHEYQILRGVIVKIVATKEAFDSSANALLHLFIDRGIREAADQFAGVVQRKIRESEIHLKSTQEQLEKALSISEIGFYDWDIGRNILTFSDQMKKDWGIETPGSLENAMTFIHPDDRERVFDEINATIENQRPYRTTYRVIQPSGAIVWIEVHGEVTFSPDGKPTRLFGATVNITERKKIEERLAFERHKLEMIFRDSPAAMAMWRGPEFVFEMVNPEYQAIFQGRDLNGKPLLEAAPELKGQPFFDHMKGVFETGDPFVGKEMLARIACNKDGELEDHFYDFTYARVLDEQGKPYGVYDHAVDVTDRVIARRELEESKERLKHTISELERETDLRERFVAALTHDLRTPMTAARMSAQLLRRRPDNPGVVMNTTDRIIRSMDRADRMIRDLLDVSLIKAGQGIPLTIDACNLDRVLRSVAKSLDEIHGPRFKVKIESDNLSGYWDCSSIERIIENLAANAIKYGSPDSPVTLRLSRQQEWVEISVHNEGNPIPADEHKNLFRQYRRSQSAQAGTQLGWGIGLALVKGLTEAHNGSVRVESEPNLGTIFFVRLPLDARPHSSLGNETPGDSVKRPYAAEG